MEAVAVLVLMVLITSAGCLEVREVEEVEQHRLTPVRHYIPGKDFLAVWDVDRPMLQEAVEVLDK